MARGVRTDATDGLRLTIAGTQVIDDLSIGGDRMVTNPGNPNTNHGTWTKTGRRQLTGRDVSFAVDATPGGTVTSIAIISIVVDFDELFRSATTTFEANVYLPGEDGEEDMGLGSGVVINDRGAILTSLHVIEDASEIQLTFADGTKSDAQVMLEQPENDIAVLSASQLPELLVPAILGNPNAMRVGAEAFAVGNPFGLYSSMTAGVISGFERTFQPPDSDQRLEGLIQKDAAVNPGRIMSDSTAPEAFVITRRSSGRKVVGFGWRMTR